MRLHLVMALCFGLMACEARETRDLFQSEAVISVETTRVVASTLEPDIHLFGVLESAEEIVLNVEFAAPVVQILIEEGHEVAKGQPMLEFDTSKLALNLEQTKHLLEQANLQLENAQLNLSRLKPLAEKSTISQQRLDDARFAEETAVAKVQELNSRLQLIRRDLDNRIVYSPIDAVLAVRHVEAGQSTTPYQPLMTLHAVRTMKVSVFAGENQLPYLRVGDPASILTASGKLDSEIHSISATSDPHTGNYEVKLLLENNNSQLRPGTTADVHLRMHPQSEQILIPETALVAWNGHHVVYVSNEGTAERRFVDVSVGFNEQIIVDHGLSQGDELIVTGAHHVTDGSHLNILGVKAP